MEVEVIESIDQVKKYKLKGSQTVAIDVLRCTSTMVTAFENGAKKIIPVDTPHKAFLLKKNNPQLVLGGERGGIKIPNFQLGNSPAEYTSDRVNQKNIVMTTTNGTRLIRSLEEAESIFIGALINAKSVSEVICGRSIFIACAGTRGKFSADDFLTAGAIVWNLMKFKNASIGENARRAVRLFQSVTKIDEFFKVLPHGILLTKKGYENDILYCSRLDISSIVPRYYLGTVYG